MYRLGVLQFEPKLLKVTENLERMAELVRNVDADLIVMPELATSGYVFNTKEEVISVAENAKSGLTARFFTQLSRERNCSFVVGFPEIDDGVLYNSCSLFNPDGRIYTYRKSHLFFEEKLFFEKGNTGFQVFEAKNNVKIGMMICFDWQFPESARTLALKGAEIIVHPANLVLPWAQKAMVTRSLENRVFSVTSDRTGTEVNGEKSLYFTGMSQILNTKGEILTQLDKSEANVSVVMIDPSEAANKQVTARNDAFADRRTDLYEI